MSVAAFACVCACARAPTLAFRACKSGNRSEQLIITEREHNPKKEQKQGKKLSAKQAKRLRKVLELKEKKKQRAELLKGLQGFTMPDAQATLMHRTSSISSKATTKEVLLQQLKEQRAGISVSGNKTGKGKVVSLLVPRTTPAVKPTVEESETDSSSEEEGQDTSAANVPPPVAVPLPAVKIAPAAEHAVGFGHLKKKRRNKNAKTEPGPASVYIAVDRSVHKARCLWIDSVHHIAMA